MRKITKQAAAAFMSGTDFGGGNTAVIHDFLGIGLYLHGHRIAIRNGAKIEISNCGYFTRATKERLNGLPGVRITQKNGDWYLNGKEWDGSWISV